MSCGRAGLQPRRVADELKTIMQDAVRCHFEPQNAPRLIRIYLVKDDVIPVCSFFEREPAATPRRLRGACRHSLQSA